MAAPAAPGTTAEYGFISALREGGPITWITLITLVVMSVGSWYIFFVKLIDQQKLIKEGRRARTSFWQ